MSVAHITRPTNRCMILLQSGIIFSYAEYTACLIVWLFDWLVKTINLTPNSGLNV